MPTLSNSLTDDQWNELSMAGLMKVITDYVNSGTVHYVLEGLGINCKFWPG
jgi:hypothetical protein